MTILEMTESSFHVTCACKRSFRTRRGGLSVECPHCGATALTADLVLSHLSRAPESSGAGPLQHVA